MPVFLASLRCLAGAATSACALVAAAEVAAQSSLPAAPLTGAELRQALIWTGHYGAFVDGEPMAMFDAATRAWQKAKGYPVGDKLSDEQIDELLAEGARLRDSAGWTMLHDKALGFSVGVPTRLAKFVATRSQNSALYYDFEGSVGYSLAVRYGDWNCATIDAVYARMARQHRPFFAARRGDWLAFGHETSEGRSYERAVCRTSGIVVASVTVSGGLVPEHGNLFAAMADSLSVRRDFNPTAIPRPRVDAAPPAPSDLLPGALRKASVAAKLPPNVDGSGKTNALTRKTRGGSDLTAEQVFEKAGAAVYTVKADSRLGSAVAISEDQLLTNCHVVGDKARVTLSRDKQELLADVTSMNAEADRCVLKTSSKLAKWVTVRPYDDIKVGERALTIGTPQGLELTVAEGIVSSKRTHNDSRMVQTSAPISRGSSGGGLFDAQGHLLGITTFYFRGGQNLNFAVAAEEYAK